MISSERDEQRNAVWNAVMAAISNPSKARAEKARDAVTDYGKRDFEAANGMLTDAMLAGLALIADDTMPDRSRYVASALLIIYEAEYPNKGVCA